MGSKYYLGWDHGCWTPLKLDPCPLQKKSSDVYVYYGTVTLRSNQLTLSTELLHTPVKKKTRTFLSPEDRSHAIFNWTHTSRRWELSEVIAFEWLKNDPASFPAYDDEETTTIEKPYQGGARQPLINKLLPMLATLLLG